MRSVTQIHCDHVGHDRGQVVFEGPPAQLAEAELSLTGSHLRQRIADREPTVRV